MGQEETNRSKLMGESSCLRVPDRRQFGPWNGGEPTECQNYHFHIKLLIGAVLERSEARNLDFGTPEGGEPTEGQNEHFHIKLLIGTVLERSEARNLDFGTPERGGPRRTPN